MLFLPKPEALLSPDDVFTAIVEDMRRRGLRHRPKLDRALVDPETFARCARALNAKVEHAPDDHVRIRIHTGFGPTWLVSDPAVPPGSRPWFMSEGT